MEPIFEAILGLGGTLAYVVIALLAFGEAAAFVGLVLPGEIAVVLGGVLASQGRVSLPLLLVVVAVAAVAGDSAGYEIGRRWGPRLLESRTARRHAHTIAEAERYLQDRGGLMVFLGRWTSVLRAVVPALAGMSRMQYPRFFLFNVIGGVAWTVAFGLAGYLAGESYHYIESATGWGSWILTGLVVAGFGIGWMVRRRRRARLLAGPPSGTDNCEKPSGDGSSGAEIPAWNVSAASDDASDTGATGVANQAVMT